MLRSLVHAFVTSHVDYCNTMLAGSPMSATDRLSVSARVVNSTGKFDRGLTQLHHSELHRQDALEHIQYKLGVTVHWCFQSRVDCCTTTLDVASSQRLHSDSCYQLIVPWHRCSSSVVGHFLLSAWWPGTLCLTISVTQCLVMTSLEHH